MLQYSFRPGAPAPRRTRTGLDQDWAVYSPIIDRPIIRWPDKARVALWICPCYVYYEFTPPADRWLNAWARTPAPDVAGYSRQEYGGRIGFWRMLEVLDKYNARCTAVVNSQALERSPEICRAMAERNWAIAGHGANNTRFVYGMSEDEERRYYREMLESVRSNTGVTMRGMGGSGPQAATESTPDLLAEAGFLYHTDWFCDDQPFPLRVRSGRLISMPYSVEMNDTLVFAAGGEADLFGEMIVRQFDQLYREGEQSGRVMCISLHPNLIGQPQRLRHLDAALAHINSHAGVWHATGDEIAAHYLEHCYDDAVRHLGARWTGAK